MKAYDSKKFNNRVGKHKQVQPRTTGSKAGSTNRRGALSTRRSSAIAKQSRSLVSTGPGRTEKFMGEAERVGNKALTGSKTTISRVAGKALGALTGSIATGIGLALTPSSLGNSELPNPPKPVPAKSQQRYSRGGGSMKTGNAASIPNRSPDTPAPTPKFKKGTKVKSGPTGPGFEGKATHAGAKFGRQVASMPSPDVVGQMGGKNSTKMEPPAKSGGFFSKVKAALTKKPTNQPTTEYAQIMSDIQPKKKK